MGESFATAWSAFRSGDWVAAADAFEAELPAAAALDGLGQVRWIQGRIDEGIALREQAYAAFVREGSREAAADAALWLAVEYASSRGAAAVAAGWFLRAERLLDGVPQCPALVELEVQRARRADTPVEAEEHYARALAIARELRFVNGEIRTLTVLGVHRVANGRVDEGMALLDEAMAAVLGGELSDPWTAGGACCQMLAACDAAADWPRAMQWCREVVPFVQGTVPLWAWCRSMYGGVLTATGDWERAEREILESLRIYGGPDRPMAAYPLARLADLRMRQGRVDEAERLVEGVEDHPRVVPTAIAVLLARGKARAAATACERCLARAGANPAGSVALLALLADARGRLGDDAGARAAVAQLTDVARELGRADLVAAAEMAAAKVSLAGGDGAAAAHLETALELYDRLGMPLEAGRARLGLAHVLDDAEPAIEEARRALRVFERLGARADADDAAALLRRLGAAGRSGPRLGEELTAREGEVLELLAEGLSNAEIASRLVIAPKTAEHHVSRILRKLDLSNRAEAAAHAVRAGLSGSAGRSR